MSKTELPLMAKKPGPCVWQAQQNHLIVIKESFKKEQRYGYQNQEFRTEKNKDVHYTN